LTEATSNNYYFGMSQTIVVAIGGNSLIENPANKTIAAQYEACRKTAAHIVPLILAGNRVVIVHGNGPQVGFILRRSELAKHELHMIPLDSCVADTQGAIGYNIQMALSNELAKCGSHKAAATVVTQVEVDTDDPSFDNPDKPIGSFMSQAEALQHQVNDGWSVREDSGRGMRRVVASPAPLRILELDVVRQLIENDTVVITCGGGGIPVARNAQGQLRGIEAVIDKDRTASLLAQELKADVFIISTAVPRVCINFGRAQQEELRELTTTRARELQAEGQFAPGSMLPKIEAMVDYLEAGGGRGIITDPANLENAVAGTAGTHMVRL